MPENWTIQPIIAPIQLFFADPLSHKLMVNACITRLASAKLNNMVKKL
jgi:hypothetical protein